MRRKTLITVAIIGVVVLIAYWSINQSNCKSNNPGAVKGTCPYFSFKWNKKNPTTSTTDVASTVTGQPIR